MNRMKTILPILTAKELKPVLAMAGGTFFSATTITRGTNERRVFNCRLGVRKGVTGQGLAFNPEEKNLINVYCTKEKDFRFINCDKLQEIKIRGIHIIFKQ